MNPPPPPPPGHMTNKVILALLDVAKHDIEKPDHSHKYPHAKEALKLLGAIIRGLEYARDHPLEAGYWPMHNRCARVVNEQVLQRFAEHGSDELLNQGQGSLNTLLQTIIEYYNDHLGPKLEWVPYKNEHSIAKTNFSQRGNGGEGRFQAGSLTQRKERLYGI